MTVLGRGDLSPPRRHRYGRRRRRWPRVLLALVLLAALGAGGYFGWRHFRNDTSTTATLTSPPCPTSTPAPPPGPPRDVGPPIRVLNASLRPGLAEAVASTLHRRFGFRIAQVGNAVKFRSGNSVVRYPPAQQQEANLVAAGVVPHARTEQVAGLSAVEVDLGSAFVRVATHAEYVGAGGQESTQATPSPAPTGTACEESVG